MRPQHLIAVLLVLAAGLGLAGTTVALEVGQKAPDVTFTGPGNKPVKLADLTAKGPVVMYTLIQAFTPT
jgi:hypothetical protein